MENQANKKFDINEKMPLTKAERAADRYKRIKGELELAKARMNEAAAREEKINRLKERKRIFAENKILGELCRIAEFNTVKKMIEEDGKLRFELDRELIVALLREKQQSLFHMEKEKKEEYRSDGRSILDFWASEQKNKGGRR